MFGTIVSQIAGILWTTVESIFTIVIPTCFSTVVSLLPTLKLFSDISKVFTIDGIICGLLGVSITFIGVIKFIRMKIQKAIK